MLYEHHIDMSISENTCFRMELWFLNASSTRIIARSVTKEKLDDGLTHNSSPLGKWTYIEAFKNESI